MHPIRTTVTLDPDVAALVRKAMRERRLTSKQTVNDVLRAALRPESDEAEFRTPTFHMQVREGVDLTKASQLAGSLEDEATLEKMRNVR